MIRRNRRTVAAERIGVRKKEVQREVVGERERIKARGENARKII